MNGETTKHVRSNGSYSSADYVRLNVPVPSTPGELIEFVYEKRNIRVIVEKMKPESQEQLRANYVVVAPVHGTDHSTHAARMGAGTISPKKMAVTICRENHRDPVPSGQRIHGLQLEHVTCENCKKKLITEGVELNGEQK